MANDGITMADESGGDAKLQARDRDPGRVLADYLSGDAVRRRLADVCNKSLRPEELVRLTLLAASRQPDLLRCAQHSILRALMDAAQLEIAPTGLQGRGYLVPRKNNRTGALEAAFDPGWRGLCDVARRSGLVAAIDAKVVYEGDRFSYVETEQGPELRHEPRLTLPDDEGDDGIGRIVAAYARARLADDAVQIEVLRRRDIDRIAATSASANGPWSTWFDEMARKSAVRRLCKYLPYSSALDYAVRTADRADGVGDEAPALASGRADAAELGEAIRGRVVSRPAALGQRSASAPDALDAGAERAPAAAAVSARREAAPQQQRAPAADGPRASRRRAGSEPEPPFGEPTPAAAAPQIDWESEAVTIKDTIANGIETKAPIATVRAYMLSAIAHAPPSLREEIVRYWNVMAGEMVKP